MFKNFIPRPFIETTDTLAGKVIIVTGGTQGIGAATVNLLQKKGAVVIPLSRSSEISVDVTDFSSCQEAVKKVIEKFGRIDVLVNNAGMFLSKSLQSTSPKEFNQVMSVNLNGVFNMSKAVVTHMKDQKSGLIINIGSKISHNTNVSPNKVTYATSKYAVEGFSFALNRELKQFGIRVTCLMPATVATFVSRQASKYLSPYDVANLIKFVIDSEHIDFESIVFKSQKQDI